MERVSLLAANQDVWPLDDDEFYQEPKYDTTPNDTLPHSHKTKYYKYSSNGGHKLGNGNTVMMHGNDDDDDLDYLDYKYSNGCDSNSALRRFRDPERETLLEEEYADRNYGAERRSGNVVARYFLLCFAMILFFLLLYIPVYKQANTQIGTVAGWSRDVSRDTKIYVQPGNTTAIHEAKNVCPKRLSKSRISTKTNDSQTHQDDDVLFLLIIVCSSTANFEARSVIRETWANYTNYVLIKKSFDEIQDKYSVIHAKLSATTRNLVVESANTNLMVSKRVRRKRGIANLEAYFPKIAAAVNSVNRSEKTDIDKGERNEDEIRFEDEDSKGLLPEFEMNKVLGDDPVEENPIDYEENEDTNVMKIPPRGHGDNVDLSEIVNALRKSEIFSNINQSVDKIIKDSVDNNKLETYTKVSSDKENKLSAKENKLGVSENNLSVNDKNIGTLSLSQTLLGNNLISENQNSVKEKLLPRYKVIFLLGLPNTENDTDVQSKIDEEAEKYGDIIQEDFIDSYNNLTLKSVMLLKWVVTHCNQRVRYILKTDDDMFVNVVNLERALEQARSSWKTGSNTGPHQMLGGDLICGARPVSDQNNKWYSPRYMYGGRFYPRYLSGTGYVFSEATAHSLYEAALHTPLFHLEDIYITGMCAAHAKPHIKPTDVAGFSYSAAKGGQSACSFYTRITAHKLPKPDMRRLVHLYKDAILVDKCERLHISQIKKDILAKKRRRRSKLKKPPKKLVKG